MLMGWGPFRFTVPAYSVEELNRRMSARVYSQPVVGRRPTTHLLGPGEETITLASTFHPHHLNRAGMALLLAVRAAVTANEPLILVHVGGLVFGRWVGTDISDGQSLFAVGGTPNTVTVSLSLTKYVSPDGPSGIF